MKVLSNDLKMYKGIKNEMVMLRIYFYTYNSPHLKPIRFLK